MLYPRKRLDLSPGCLIRALWDVLTAGDAQGLRSRLERTLDGTRATALALYSVRTGFDLMLRALQLDKGAEVLMSAVNIPDFPRIVAEHGLRSVPVDIDRANLAPTLEQLERAWSPRARMLVVAHLFGARVAVGPIAEWCRERRILLVEDAAQAWGGDGFLGHEAADLRFFSFGPLKTATCLGGAIGLVADRSLAARMRAIESGYPIHPRALMLRRTVLYGLAYLLSNPRVYGLVVKGLERRFGEVDSFLERSVLRALYHGDFWGKLRRRAPASIFKLLHRRLRERGAVANRVALATRLIDGLPGVARPGSEVRDHVHWVFPVLSHDPSGLVRMLRGAGFDASRSVSSLAVIDPPQDRPDLTPLSAHEMMRGLVYLPFDQRMSAHAVERMAALVLAFESEGGLLPGQRDARRPAA